MARSSIGWSMSPTSNTNSNTNSDLDIPVGFLNALPEPPGYPAMARVAAGRKPESHQR